MIYLKYSGTINRKTDIRKMADEFSDICRISGWDFEPVIENFQSLTSGKSKRGGEYAFEPDDEELLSLSSSDVHLEGMTIKIEGGIDPARFTFDKNGKLATISFCTTDTIGLNTKLTVKKYEFLYYPYIKAFTSGAENHLKTVKVLDYIKKKYIHDLEVVDTSFFWDNRDEEDLKVRVWKSARDRNLAR
ncbi:MAG TPA: hypothetical protein ENN43_01510 [bacterium]|nr:hypothetical protein [bacterium]